MNPLIAKLNKIAGWYFSRRAMPYWSILAIDCLFVVAAGLLAFSIHHGAAMTVKMASPLLITLFGMVLCYVVAFRLFHTYNGIIRFSSFSDLIRVGAAVMTALVLVFAVKWIFAPASWVETVNGADIIFMGLFAIAFMWICRVWVKMMYERTLHRSEGTRAFILGVKEGGIALAKNIKSSADLQYTISGFLTDEPELKNRRLMGVKVYPFDDNLPRLARSMGVRTIIVSPLKMDSLRNNEKLVDELVLNRINLLVIPRAKQWDGKSDLRANELHPVAVEDLLPREKIEVDMEAASALIRNHAVMITGAAGSIGSEIVRQVATYRPAKLILIDQAETPMHDIRRMMAKNHPDIETLTIVSDISDAQLMERIFSSTRPQYVFHAAAYKHVPMMEDNPYEAVVNNVGGTKILADLAVKYGTKKFVMVSTDKAVNPTNVMGCSKRICEIYVQSLDQMLKESGKEDVTQFVTTRFGNVLGSNGSVIPIFQEQINQGGPVTVTHPDIIRFFMLIPEACRLVIEAGTMGKGGEIYVFDMGNPVRIADLAKRMIKLSGAPHIRIEYTGLRDGEKLYEEVLNDQEITLPTFHPKIKVAKVRLYAFDTVSESITAMIDGASTETDIEIVARMKALVPEFRSKHSKFECLDK